MQALAGLLILAVLIAVAGTSVARAWKAATAKGILPLRKRPKPTRSKPLTVRDRARRVTEAIQAKRPTRRAEQPKQGAKDPKPTKPPLLERLVFPNGRQQITTTEPGDMPMTDGSGIRDDTEPRPVLDAVTARRTPPAPTPPGGPVTTSATTGGSSAGDFMSATTRVIAEAEAGGIQAKARGGLVMGEGLKQLAAAMEQHARHLQERGEYPAYVWEPWRQAAQLAHAAASKTTEAGTAAAELARRPMGEANGQAPHRDELNKR